MLAAAIATSAIADDHGDTPTMATLLPLSVPVVGTVAEDDVDVFRIDLAGTSNVEMRTTGQTDTSGTLTDSSGTELASDEDAGPGDNFSIEAELGSGIYYLHVTGNGAYAADMRVIDGGTDLHGDTLESSSLLRLVGDAEAATIRPEIVLGKAGHIRPVDDVDVFRIDVAEATTVQIRAAGAANANATLVDADDQTIIDDHGDGNFDFTTELAAGIYYLKMTGGTIGNYRLLARDHGPVREPDLDGDGIPDSEDMDIDGDGVANMDDAFPTDPYETMDSDLDGTGDNADPIASTYAYDGVFADGSSVSYTGQTARHLLMLGMVRELNVLVEDAGNGAAVDARLRFYMTGDGADDVPHGFTVAGGESVIPGPNYGDVSTGKNLAGKIAGGDGMGGGETGRLIGDFFGWETGLGDGALPIDLVWYFIDRVAAEASDGAAPLISTTDGMVSLDTVLVDAHGVDYRQMLQKFLGGAVAFSQGTNDYFQTDWANKLDQEDDKNFTAGEHDFDEAFGYYGAARDMNDYTDDEAAAKGGRPGWEYGYYDTNQDGSIDVRSEFVLGHAQNCAKRDRGSGDVTDYSKEAMDAFLLGREILGNAAQAGSMSDAALVALHDQISIAAKTWEKCIAATVVHYINDTAADMYNYDVPVFADLANFSDMAKHWAEMKGFALALQFSPFSPFRDGSVADIDLDDLRNVLALMGDAPVLADGSQGGVAATGDAAITVQNYIAGLMTARHILQTAYGFDPAVVANW